MKSILKHIGIGAGAGLSISAAFIILLIAIPPNPTTKTLASGFVAFCKPLEWGRLGDMLAERQDPLLSFSLMVAYWSTVGALLGTMTWVVGRISRK